MDARIRNDAEALLVAEADFLDRQDWESWLALYAEDAIFWVPAWKSENQPTSNPDREISLIYYASRLGLEERVQRLRTGKSITTQPMLRTVHMLSNVEARADAAGDIAVRANWTVHSYDPRLMKSYTLFGRYEHRLKRRGAALVIARKKITLVNDYVPTMIDFYSL